MAPPLWRQRGFVWSSASTASPSWPTLTRRTSEVSRFVVRSCVSRCADQPRVSHPPFTKCNGFVITGVDEEEVDGTTALADAEDEEEGDEEDEAEARLDGDDDDGWEDLEIEGEELDAGEPSAKRPKPAAKPATTASGRKRTAETGGVAAKRKTRGTKASTRSEAAKVSPPAKRSKPGAASTDGEASAAEPAQPSPTKTIVAKATSASKLAFVRPACTGD